MLTYPGHLLLTSIAHLLILSVVSMKNDNTDIIYLYPDFTHKALMIVRHDLR